VGNEVTAQSKLHPISKRCIQDNVPQFGSIKCSASNDIVPTPFPNIDPRNPTSDKHPHLYNHASLGNVHKVFMDKIRAEDNSIVLCSPCEDESFEGTEGESSSSTYSVACSTSSVDEHENQSSRICPKSYERTNVPPATVAQIHLANILQKHKCDLNLFDEVTNWVKHHSTENNVDWKNSTLVNRKSLVSSVEKLVHAEDMKPTEVDVKLCPTGTSISVPVFDFTSMLLSIIHDPHCMKKENIIPNYDLFTGKSTDPQSSMYYGDMHTGSAFQKAYKEYITPNNNEIAVPLYLFIDETYTDLHGALSTAPIIFTVAWLSQECRNSPDFWRPAGFIPNLSYGLGKNCKTGAHNKLQNLHNCISAILKPLQDIIKNGGIRTYITDFNGEMKEVTLKPWIHLVIGDTKGNNELCGHYNSSKEIQRPYRDCKCCFSKMSDSDPKCEYITKEEVDEFSNIPENVNDMNQMKDISKYKINNAFSDLPLADNDAGIYRHVPPEVLHEFGNGIYGYFFQIFHDIFGIKKSKKRPKEEIEVLHNQVVADFARQSDRSFPRRSSRNGPLDGTKMGATERRGNLFAFIIAITTKQGGTLMTNNLKKHKIPYGPFVKTLKLCLAYEKWIHDVNPKEEVVQATKWVAKLKRMIKKHLNRTKICSSGNGWNIPKFHGLSKFIMYMTIYGCGANFFGGPCESALKKFVKYTGFNTQRRVSSFVTQVARRNYECMVLEVGYEKVREKCADFELEIVQPCPEPIGDDSSVHSDMTVDDFHLDNVDESQFEGCHNITICEEVNGERGFVSKWKDGKKNVVKCPISKQLVNGLCRKANRDKRYGSFDVKAYTCYKHDMNGTKIIYRATEQYSGSEWYDFGSVKYNDIGFFPSKILGFIQYRNGDIPPESRDNMYAVIQCSTKPLSTDQIDEKFTATFDLGCDDGSFDVVPVESIENPILAIKSYGFNHIERYITATPYDCWGKYFSSEMMRLEAKEEQERREKEYKLAVQRENKRKRRKSNK